MNQSFSEKMRWITFICSIFIALLHLSVPFTNNGQWIIQYYQQLAIPAMSFFSFLLRIFTTGIIVRPIMQQNLREE